MKMTRRFCASLLIIFAPLLLSISRTFGEDSKESHYFAVIATYTSKTDGKAIYSLPFDASPGRVAARVLAAPTQDPSFLTVATNGKYLYAVNELAQFDGKKSGA